MKCGLLTLWRWMARTWLCVFSDGHCGVLDMSPYMDDGVFKRLRDPNVFRTARAGVSNVEWDNGTIDIAPETAYAHAVPFGV